MKNYEALGAEIGRLVAEKETEYGRAHEKVAKILEILFPSGIPVTQSCLTIVRVLDKVCRIARGNMGKEDAWVDLAGYGLLQAASKHTEDCSECGCILAFPESVEAGLCGMCRREDAHAYCDCGAILVSKAETFAGACATCRAVP